MSDPTRDSNSVFVALLVVAVAWGIGEYYLTGAAAKAETPQENAR